MCSIIYRSLPRNGQRWVVEPGEFGNEGTFARIHLEGGGATIGGRRMSGSE